MKQVVKPARILLKVVTSVSGFIASATRRRVVGLLLFRVPVIRSALVILALLCLFVLTTGLVEVRV